MLIAFVSVSLLIGIFMTYIWSSNGFANCAIKMGFTIYSLWAAAIFISSVVPHITASGMRVF